MGFKKIAIKGNQKRKINGFFYKRIKINQENWFDDLRNRWVIGRHFSNERYVITKIWLAIY